MSVLSRSRSLTGTPVVPKPRAAAHDGGLTAPVRSRTGQPVDQPSRRRRAALVLVALILVIAAAVTTAVVQFTGDAPKQLAPGTGVGQVTELDRIRDEMVLRRHLSSDANRASDAARDASLTGRR